VKQQFFDFCDSGKTAAEKTKWQHFVQSLPPHELQKLREKSAQKTREWYAAKPLEERQRLNQQSSERRRKRKELYTAEQIERDRKRQRDYVRERRRKELRFKLICTCRSRVNRAMAGKAKSAKTMKLIGCTPEKLIEHLESKFTDGMSWENHGAGNGKWQVDHVLPIAWFNLESEPQQSRAFHYTNLQPLWAIDNHRKGARRK